ncbi:hypothetical protein ACNKHK_08780 [Shigella flexneri]
MKTGTFNQFIRGGIAFATPPGTPLAPKAQAGKHFLLLESEPKEWREWEPPCPIILHLLRRTRAGALMLNCAPVFCRWYQLGPIFPDAFLTKMREAMPSTLSFDDSLAARQRPLRRSIRVKTLKISVADFLTLTAPYNWSLTPVPWCAKVSGSNVMKKSSAAR